MKNKFPLLVLFLATLLFSNCKEEQSDLAFELSPDDLLQKAMDLDYFHPLYEVTDSALNTPENFTLVDLRSPNKFAIGHLPNAVNIPTAQLLEEEAIGLLRNSRKVVLYGSERSAANGPWLLLTQLGLSQISILEFGYQDIVKTGSVFSPETAHYDFASIFQKATERHQQELEAGKPKPVVAKQKKVIVPKKKKKIEEEGC